MMKLARRIVIVATVAAVLVAAATLATHGARAGAPKSAPAFTNTPLLLPNGDSEPAITIGNDSTMVVSGLSWQLFQTNIWKGAFGATPAFQGGIDTQISAGVGGGDADTELGATGTLHTTTLMFFFNPATKLKQLGVSAITCPHADTSNTFANCTSQIIDTTQADRSWVASDGKTVFISYHDSGSSTTVHVQRSDDDGITWRRVGDPIVGQGSATGSATFNNDNGPLAVDPVAHIVYDVYSAGQASVQKGTSGNFNQIFVSRSADGGQTWTASLVFTAPLFTALNNVFPTVAVDPLTGTVYAAWSDAHGVSIASSTDHGATWSAAQTVNTGTAATAVFPALAARGGTVDLAYYGTSAASKDDPGAVWNTYMAQSKNGSAFVQTQITAHPNHVGVICTNGTGCAAGTRNLLDLFEIAIDPASGRAAVIYTDDTLTTDSSGSPLPQIALAQQTA
jgi:hypothetical protein